MLREMKAIEQAVSVLGGTSKAAAALGVWPQSVTNWKARGRAPANQCIAIEAATKGAVTRYDLRPDVFGDHPNE